MNRECSVAAVTLFEYLLNAFKMSDFLLPFQRKTIEQRVLPFHQYRKNSPFTIPIEPNYTQPKPHLVSKAQNIPIDEGKFPLKSHFSIGIQHLKVMKSTYPDLEKENNYEEVDNGQDWSFSRQEAMEK